LSGVDADRAQEDAHVDGAADPPPAGPGRDRRDGEPEDQRLDVLGELAGRVAHDFNNLLAVIINYAAFAAEELAAGPRANWAAAARDVDQIQRAAERAATLTGQLRVFARRDAVRPRVLHLDDVITDAAPLLRRTLGAEIELRTDLAADPWPVLADAGRIEQVLVNLAANARDAMSGGGTLTIETRNVDAGTDGAPIAAGRYVRLRVSDTGSGMGAEVVEHAFEPFYTTSSGIGAGLGLSTVYGIVAQAGATIDIRSRPGAGTTVTILVPVTDDRAEPVQEAPTPV
jgi:signal transduction histidine kinase